MRLLEEAGLPAGRDQHGAPATASPSPRSRWPHRDLAGIHFTGSTPVFQHLWRTVGENIARYRGYPRIVGETGGKDFVVAHPSRRRRRAAHRADPRRLRVPGPEVLGGLARLRAAQRLGAGCATTSSAETESLPMGDVTDFSNFMGAVIDRRSFAKLSGVLDRGEGRRRARPSSPAARPTTARASSSGRPIIEGTDPGHEVFTTEYFGPVLAVHVYDDADYDAVLTQMESVAPYALTGSIIAQDRTAIAHAQQRPALRGRQLLRQRQADRRRRRPAAVRRRPRLGHQRQGRRRAEPACAGPAPGRSRRPSSRATDHRYPHMG